MANPSKNKGDRAEREAVAVLIALAPTLVIAGAKRMLGAGRKEDVGDLHVFPDVAVQVKSMKAVSTAVREAAAGAVVQAGHAGHPYALGMVPIPLARTTSVRWLAVCLTWPDRDVASDAIAVFGICSKAIEHLRNEKLGIPRERRLAMLRTKGLPDLVIAPIEAWLAAYRADRLAGPISAADGSVADVRSAGPRAKGRSRAG